jgi:hypothetical protein
VIRVPCSPEQEDVIADHLFKGGPLGMQPDERAWIIAQVKQLGLKGRVKAADLDLASGEWILELQE